MKTKFKLFKFTSYIIGIILTICMIPIYLNFVDPYSLLVTESGIVTAFRITATILIAAVFVLPFFLFKKTDYPEKIENTGFSVFTSSLLGFLFIGYFVSCVVMYIKMRLGEVNIFSSNYLSQDKIVQVLYIAGIILALPSAAYFIAIALKKVLYRTSSLCFLSLFPVLWFAIRLIYIFMRNSAIVNAAGRKLDIITICLCVFFFLAQAKLTAPISEKNADRKALRVFLATGYCAITALITSQISRVFLQVSNFLNPSDTYIINALHIVLFLYITARIDAVTKNYQD